MTITDFKSAFKRTADRQAEHHTATIALNHVVLPLAIAILGISSPFLWGIKPVIPIILWVFLFLVYALVWWKTAPTYDDVNKLLIQKQHDDELILGISEENENFQELISDLYFKNIASFVFRAMTVDYIKSINESGLSREYFSEILDEMLAPFYLNGDSIFGFDVSEKWSMSVYIFDKDQNMLSPVWRQKSASHPSQGLGRRWRVGEGHVGKAFLDRRPILTGNSNDDAVAQLCKARESKQLVYDNSTYVSFASVPIGIADDDNVDPFGVLVVTSSQKDRLSEESATELLMHAAETIAVILDLSDVDISCLSEPNHDMRDTKEEDADDGQKAEAQ